MEPAEEGKARPRMGRPPREPGRESRQTNLWLHVDFRDRLKIASLAQGKSAAALVEQWCSPHLERYAEEAELLAEERRRREEEAREEEERRQAAEEMGLYEMDMSGYLSRFSDEGGGAAPAQVGAVTNSQSHECTRS